MITAALILSNPKPVLGADSVGTRGVCPRIRHTFFELRGCLRHHLTGEDAGDTDRKESNGPRPESESGGRGQTSNCGKLHPPPCSQRAGAGTRLGGGGGVTASSKKGETEPVIRCVAEGPEGWLQVRPYHGRLGPAQGGSRMFSETPAPHRRAARGTLTGCAVALW